MATQFSFRRLGIRFVFLSLLAMIGLFAMSWLSTAPDFPAEGGARNFAPCPESPNCVSTQATSLEQQIKPIPWTESSAEAADLIKRTIGSEFSRSKLVVEKPNYLRYEFTSFLFRFVDDVEFMIDENTRLIHLRSASRVGHSDLGANRRRMDRFTKALDRAMSFGN